jgi:hypothetical protein
MDDPAVGQAMSRFGQRLSQVRDVTVAVREGG